MTKKKGNRYYTRTLKDGTIKRRVHGADGKILRWEIAEDLDTPSGEYKMIEYSMYFIPTRATAKSFIPMQSNTGQEINTIRDLIMKTI